MKRLALVVRVKRRDRSTLVFHSSQPAGFPFEQSPVNHLSIRAGGEENPMYGYVGSLLTDILQMELQES